MARALWSGSVSFGLVNIPVRVLPAIREHDIRFRQLARDGSRIRYKRVSDKTGREVPYEDIRKGYETSKGKYVVFEKEELEELQPPTTRTIDIEDFVALEDIDPVYFARTYHLAPDGEGAAKAYALLASVMRDRDRVGIGSVVMREKQYLCAIRPYGSGLTLSTMLFADEVVSQSDIEEVPSRRPRLNQREKQLAGQVVDALDRDWDPKRYHDTYQEQLREIIKAKQKGEAIEIEEPEEPSAQVIDLTEALQASLEGRGRPTRRKRRPAARKRQREGATRPARTRRTSRSRSRGRSRRSA